MSDQGTATASLAAQATTPALLRIEHAGCDLGRQRVVRDVSFALEPGQLGCLLGPSGCGKTSLLRAIAGFQPLAAGRIELRGREVSSVGARVAPEQRGIGFVFQDLALFPHLDVSGNVAFGLDALPRAQRELRVRETLELLELDRLGQRFPHELSGGQQQRVALARSLAPQPDLLLLDEPFSSLDAHLRLSLRSQLRNVLKQLGVTALLVTHDQDEAFGFADRIGVMRDGALEQWDSAFDIYHRPVSRFVARFVGEGRFLRGEVIGERDVATTLGPLHMSADAGFPPGTAVDVLIRPDDVRPDGDAGIEADVVHSAFRGAETFYTLRLDDGEEVSALFPSHLRHGVGERVRIQLDLEHVVVFEHVADRA